MSNGKSSDSHQITAIVNQVMSDEEIASFVSKNNTVKPRAEKAVECLIEKNPKASLEQIVKATRGLLQPLLSEKLTVFFSYKGKDRKIADKIAKWLEDWSAGKLKMEHMGRFGFEEVGLEYRKKIEETIPKCDWFLLLLPSPGDEGNESFAGTECLI